jgi:hypothetical protein
MRYPSWLKKHHKICALINQLQLEDEKMREIMKEATGKTSRADLTEIEQIQFISRLETLIPRDKGHRRGPYNKYGNQILMASAEQKKLIEDIFYVSLGWDKMRLAAFISKMTNMKATGIDTLAKYSAANIIEAGKNMQKRQSIKGEDGQHSGESPARA